MKPENIRALADRGFSAQQIADIAEIEWAQNEAKRAKDRARQQAKRDAAKPQMEIVTQNPTDSIGVRVIPRDTVDGVSPSSSSPSTPPLITTTPSSPSSLRSDGGHHSRKRGAILPDDWRPNEKHFTEGAKLNLSRADMLRMADDMRLWAAANSNRAVARKADWDSTFLGWLRREAGKTRGTGPPRQQQPSFHEIAADIRSKIHAPPHSQTADDKAGKPLEGELFPPPMRSVG